MVRRDRVCFFTFIETRGYGAFLVVCLFVVVELGLIDEGLWSRLEGEAAIEGRWCRIETNAGGETRNGWVVWA